MKFDATINAANIALILAAVGDLADPESVDVSLVGSMFTDGQGSDYDYVVLVSGDRNVAKSLLHDAGFYITGQESGAEDDFTTLRYGDINVMLTDELGFFLDFNTAARVTKYVQHLCLTAGNLVDWMLTKEQRIKIHRIIMNGEDA